MNIYFDDDFIKTSQKLSPVDKTLIKKSVALVLQHYEGHPVPAGLGLKKLGMTSLGSVWEVRAGLHWRVIFLEGKNHSALFFRRVATHDEVREFLRRFL
jgi:mRNA-degrading endonuclease RelE of RelBE toxin-antitoxin system